MPILTHASRLAYYPVPKNACSSVKMALRTAETGEPSTIDQAHEWAPSPGYEPAPEGYTRFCVVRHPVERFLSAYRNKVLQLDQLAQGRVDDAAVKSLGLRYRPDLEFFALNMVKYAAISPSIESHFKPQAHFLGSDLTYFDEVFAWNDLARLDAFLLQRVGLRLPPSQRDVASSASMPDVPGWLPRYLAGEYAGDYALLGKYYRR